MKKILIIALFLLPVTGFAQSVPDFPMAFWGEVTVDEAPAPAGSIIRVYDEASVVGEVTVQEAGVYGYTSPTKQKLVLGEGAGTLTFAIESPTINNGAETQGLTPITHEGFVSGATVEFNLAFDVLEEVIEEPPRSSGGGGGGGGGGGRSRTTAPDEQVLGVATTSFEGLSEEEIKIELQKQIIALLTQLLALLQQQLGVSTM
jgi:hypothetical protein